MNYLVDLDMEKTDDENREEMKKWTADELLYLFRVYINSSSAGMNATRQLALLREEILRRCGEEVDVGDTED